MIGQALQNVDFTPPAQTPDPSLDTVYQGMFGNTPTPAPVASQPSIIGQPADPSYIQLGQTPDSSGLANFQVGGDGSASYDPNNFLDWHNNTNGTALDYHPDPALAAQGVVVDPQGNPIHLPSAYDVLSSGAHPSTLSDGALANVVAAFPPKMQGPGTAADYGIPIGGATPVQPSAGLYSLSPAAQAALIPHVALNASGIASANQVPVTYAPPTLSANDDDEEDNKVRDYIRANWQTLAPMDPATRVKTVADATGVDASGEGASSVLRDELPGFKAVAAQPATKPQTAPPPSIVGNTPPNPQDDLNKIAQASQGKTTGDLRFDPTATQVSGILGNAQALEAQADAAKRLAYGQNIRITAYKPGMSDETRQDVGDAKTWMDPIVQADINAKVNDGGTLRDPTDDEKTARALGYGISQDFIDEHLPNESTTKAFTSINDLADSDDPKVAADAKVLQDDKLWKKFKALGDDEDKQNAWLTDHGIDPDGTVGDTAKQADDRDDEGQSAASVVSDAYNTQDNRHKLNFKDLIVGGGLTALGGIFNPAGGAGQVATGYLQGKEKGASSQDDVDKEDYQSQVAKDQAVQQGFLGQAQDAAQKAQVLRGQATDLGNNLASTYLTAQSLTNQQQGITDQQAYRNQQLKDAAMKGTIDARKALQGTSGYSSRYSFARDVLGIQDPKELARIAAEVSPNQQAKLAQGREYDALGNKYSAQTNVIPGHEAAYEKAQDALARYRTISGNELGPIDDMKLKVMAAQAGNIASLAHNRDNPFAQWVKSKLPLAKTYQETIKQYEITHANDPIPNPAYGKDPNASQYLMDNGKPITGISPATPGYQKYMTLKQNLGSILDATQNLFQMNGVDEDGYNQPPAPGGGPNAPANPFGDQASVVKGPIGHKSHVRMVNVGGKTIPVTVYGP